MPDTTIVNHIIGHARTIRTAVMVVEYLRGGHRAKSYHEDQISYVFKEPTHENGWWSADIVIKGPLLIDDKEISEAVQLCRAFVAGAGEVWA